MVIVCSDPRLGGDPKHWGRGALGPQFRLSPAFVDYDGALLGRADFFQAFTVTFQEDRRAPVFHLDH